MARPLSLDDEDDDFEDDFPKSKQRLIPLDDEEDPPPRRPRRTAGTDWMPAGSPAAVIIVLFMAAGFVVAAVAGISVVKSLIPTKSPSQQVAADSPTTPEPETHDPLETGNKSKGDNPRNLKPTEKLSAGVVPLAIPADRILRTIFAGGESGHAAIVTSKSAGTGREVYVVNTETGSTLGQVTLGTERDAGFAVSPDGTILAVLGSAPATGRPVVLYRVATGAVIARFTPHPTARAQSSHDVIFVAFLTNDELLTVTLNGRLDVWSSTTQQRLRTQTVNLRNLTRLDFDSTTHCPLNFGLSADGKTIAIFNGAGFRFYSTESLELQAQTEAFVPSNVAITFSGAAMNANGTRFACYYQISGSVSHVAIGVWDPATGKRIESPELQRIIPPAGFAWWGSDHLMLMRSGLSSCELFDVKTMRPSGVLRARVYSKLCGMPPNDQAWSIVGGPEANRSYLVRASLPSPPRPDTLWELGENGLEIAN
jgi:hypothetical protein